MAASQTVRKPGHNSGNIINEDTNQVNDVITLSDRIKPKRKRGKRKSKAIIPVLTEQNQEADCSQVSTLYLNAVDDVSSVDLAAISCISSVNIEKVKDNTEKLFKMENSKTNADNTNKSDKIAQRQAKKQAKLAAKLKSKNKSEETGKKSDIPPQISLNEKHNTVNQLSKLRDNCKSNKAELSEGNKINTSRTEEIVIKIESSEDKNVPVEKAKIANIDKIQVTEVSKNTEKSREEIKAEREARKKAKLDAKSKGKVNQEVSKSECDVNDKSLGSTAIKESNKSKDVILEKNQSADIGAGGKSKAELRAERRAKQEAQRAAKEAEKRSKLPVESKEVSKQTVKKVEVSVEYNKINKEKMISITPKVGHQRVKLFSHLKFEHKSCETSLTNSIHPQVVQLAIKYSSRIIMGSNARCIALLKVLKEVIMDYVIPSEKEFSRALESHLSTLMAYLNKFRPSSVSMTNAVRHIKSHLTQLPNDITDVEARRKLCDVIDTYIREQIDVAGEAICNTVQNKIANGDNILIYACSSLLYRILVESHKSGKQFTVVVVDSGPWFEGREMLRRLVDHGIKCSYVLVSALTFIMRGVSKVLLGAHALLANGSVMSRAGSALVALVANSYNVPVLVCCETYKFCERVQMDAFVYNELGTDEDMEYSRCKEIKENESAVASLSVLYDITPADLVTAVVTELAILPCTSVPVILRIKPSDVVT